MYGLADVTVRMWLVLTMVVSQSVVYVVVDLNSHSLGGN
jgi:hypothetical protein